MQSGFFDLQDRHAQLSAQGDVLERLNAAIDWELFRPVLAKLDVKARKSSAGRKPIDRILMLKMLIVQRLHNLSDESLEFQVRDRLSFMRFLGLHLESSVPDARTVWAFKEELKAHGLIDMLFDHFNTQLQRLGVGLKAGQMIDATFIPVPTQRNTRAQNETIKAGGVPTEWQEDPKTLAHKDVDARWVKKNDISHYGYKNSINVDAKDKIITQWVVTDASVHDSQAFDAVVLSAAQGGAVVYADSAYRSKETEELLQAQGMDSQIHERNYQGKPLSSEQIKSNRIRSKTRSRVEHVFGHIQNSMGGKMIRTIGVARAHVQIGLMNLVYNLSRVATLIRLGRMPMDRVCGELAF